MEQQLDPKSVWLFFFMIVLRFGFVAIWLGFMFTIFLTEVPWFSQNVFLSSVADRPLAFVILGLTLAYAWAYLTYRFYRYELREDGFRKEFGVIWKKYNSNTRCLNSPLWSHHALKSYRGHPSLR